MYEQRQHRSLQNTFGRYGKIKHLLTLLLFISTLSLADEIAFNKKITVVQSKTNKVENYNYLNQIYFSYYAPKNNQAPKCTLQNIEITNTCNDKYSAWSDGIYSYSEARHNYDGLICSHTKLKQDKYEITMIDKYMNVSKEYNFILDKGKLVGFSGKHTYLDTNKNKYDTVNYIHVGPEISKMGRNEIPTSCKTINFYDDFHR